MVGVADQPQAVLGAGGLLKDDIAVAIVDCIEVGLHVGEPLVEVVEDGLVGLFVHAVLQLPLVLALQRALAVLDQDREVRLLVLILLVQHSLAPGRHGVLHVGLVVEEVVWVLAVVHA